MKQFDAIVIGAGPAGITAALYLLRAGMSVALVEKLSTGGQVLTTEHIENYPGFPKGIKGWEFADLLNAHLDEYKPVRFRDGVTSIEPEEGAHRVLVGKEWLEGKVLVICTGAWPRKLELPNEARLIGKGISFCALCDGNFFKNQVVGVVGGGNSALEESLYLSNIVKELHLIHRREGFRADRIYQDKVRATPNIILHLDSVVSALQGDFSLKGVTLRNVKTNDESPLPLDGLFIFTGYVPAADFAPEGIQRDAAGFIKTDEEMRTSIPGIFAAGDIRSKLCRQITTAVGDGATAATAASVYLEKLHA